MADSTDPTVRGDRRTTARRREASTNGRRSDLVSRGAEQTVETCPSSTPTRWPPTWTALARPDRHQPRDPGPDDTAADLTLGNRR